MIIVSGWGGGCLVERPGLDDAEGWLRFAQGEAAPVERVIALMGKFQGMIEAVEKIDIVAARLLEHVAPTLNTFMCWDYIEDDGDFRAMPENVLDDAFLWEEMAAWCYVDSGGRGHAPDIDSPEVPDYWKELKHKLRIAWEDDHG